MPFSPSHTLPDVDDLASPHDVTGVRAQRIDQLGQAFRNRLRDLAQANPVNQTARTQLFEHAVLNALFAIASELAEANER